MRQPILALLLSTLAVLAQDWHACDVWGYPSLFSPVESHGVVSVRFPDMSARWPYMSTVAMLTTTNTPALLGDLTGELIEAEIVITTSNSPAFFLGTCSPGLPPNVRLFFTSDDQPYDVDHANRNETAYWWSDFAMMPLTNRYGRLVAALEPELWSDALGHSGADPDYLAAFRSAIANVRQIGFSFGGGCFFDVGVGVTDPSTSANLRVLRYQVFPSAICQDND